MFTVPFVVCLVGLLLWILFTRPIPPPRTGHWIYPVFAEAGRIMFAFGLLVTLLGVQAKALF